MEFPEKLILKIYTRDIRAATPDTLNNCPIGVALYRQHPDITNVRVSKGGVRFSVKKIKKTLWYATPVAATSLIKAWDDYGTESEEVRPRQFTLLLMKVADMAPAKTPEQKSQERYRRHHGKKLNEMTPDELEAYQTDKKNRARRARGV